MLQVRVNSLAVQNGDNGVDYRCTQIREGSATVHICMHTVTERRDAAHARHPLLAQLDYCSCTSDGGGALMSQILLQRFENVSLLSKSDVACGASPS